LMVDHLYLLQVVSIVRGEYIFIAAQNIPLDPNAHGEQNTANGHDLPAHALAVVHLGLSGPVEELDNILGHLRGGGGGAVLVLDKAVVENTGHGDTSTGEVRVEVEARGDDGARRRLLRVTGQKREDVVAATVAGLGDERKIRGQGTVVGGAAGLVVLVRVGDVVGKLAGALLDLTLIVRLGVVLVLLGEGLGLVDGHHGADKCAPWDTGERVARGANLTVDLETTAESGVIEGLEVLLVLPRVGGSVETVGDGVSACSVRSRPPIGRLPTSKSADCIDLPLLGGSHGVHRTSELEVVEAAGSNGEGCRSREHLPGGGGGRLALSGGIALSIIVRQLPYVPSSFRHPRSLHCHRFRGSGELGWMAGYILRTEALWVAWLLAEAKARAVRTPDLASILKERVSALETAGVCCRGGMFAWVVEWCRGCLLATAS
jgi:hypothetical protein